MLQHSPRRSPALLPATWLVAAVLLLGGCGQDRPADGARPRRAATGSERPRDFDASVLRRGNGPEPDTLDPQLARTDAAFNILRDLFEGLTAVSPDGSPVPAAAESWTVSPDGLEYRFTLRPGLRWSNGDPLRAADFVTGMRRLVDPQTASPYAQFIDPILNAAAIARGEKPPGELGVTAVDDRTLLIRLATPAPYLLGLLAQPGTFPVHSPSLAAHGAEYARPGKLLSNGAVRARRLGARLARRRAPQPALLEQRRAPRSSRCTTCTSPTRARSCASTAPASSTSPTSCRRSSSSGSGRTWRPSCTSRRS